MATLTTPRMNWVGTFDANNSYTFTFSYSDTQVKHNRLVIKTNDTLETVYDQKIDAMRLSHKVEGGTLTNNKDYVVQVQVSDDYGGESELSEMLVFSCHSTPTFKFTYNTDKEVISVAKITTSIDFSQEDGDAIKEYLYELYDENKVLIKSSDAYFDITEYTYVGLENHSTYYIRAHGTSKFGFTLDTGYHIVSTNFDTVDPNLALETANDKGRITIDTNIITVDYEIVGDVRIVDNEMYVGEDSSITYPINKAEDLLLIIKGHNLCTRTVFKVTFENYYAVVSIVQVGTEYYAKLVAYDNNDEAQYVLYKEITVDESLIGSEDGVLADYDGNLFVTNKLGEMKKLNFDFVIRKKKNLLSLNITYT